MWLFIVSDSLTFSALLVSYAYVRLATPDWPRPFEIWPAIAKSSLMTFVLLSSSLTMVLGVAAAHRHDVKKTVRYLIFTMICGAAFVLIHATEWITLFHEGSHAVVQSLGRAALRRHFLWPHRAAHAARDDRRRLSRNHLRGDSARGSRLPTTSKSAAFTGTSSIWSGCLFSRWSIC